MLIRSLHIMSQSKIPTSILTRNYTWEMLGGAWGTIQMLDPGGKGYNEPYRTGGKDTVSLIPGYPNGPITRDQTCLPSSPWYPFCSGILSFPIMAQQGALPKNPDLISMNEGNYNFIEDIFYPIYWAGQLAYYLYKDKSLPGVYNPGGHFTFRTQTSGVGSTLIYNPKDSYSINGYSLGESVVSGTTLLNISPQWETISSGVGFYRDTTWMQEGGFLRIGPNNFDELSICKILDITSVTGVTVTELLFDFNKGTSIYYWFSDIAPQTTYFVTEGHEADSGGEVNGGEKETSIQINTRGGMTTTTAVEEFIPIPWAIPAPYSIRNIPSTHIWLRLDSPSMPFNLNTLVFKVNGLAVTPDVVLIPGGITLDYDPAIDFEMSSRVYVDIDISCSPSMYRSFAVGAAAESQFITIGGGSIASFQAGGYLHLGPNGSGQEEYNTVAYVSDEDEIRLGSPTQYEYTVGDLIIYTYDDYPVEISYYFDIVEDFRPPTFERFDPVDGEQNVGRYRTIMFDIKDEGLGIDIGTLSFTVDNMIVIPTIYKFSDNWYRVVYDPPVPYYYNAVVSCFATVMDLSARKNRAFVTWSFNTLEGQQPILINPNPSACAYPVHLNSHIELDIFARDAGANLQSMIFTWDQKEYKVITYPKIYRES